VIRAVVFDLDNTLTDFMKMKDASIMAAVDSMIDAGLTARAEDARTRIYEIYSREGIEDQQVFDRFLRELLGHVDHRLLAAAIVGYRRARASSLVLYPHVNVTLLELIRRGVRLAVISDAPRLQAWLRLADLRLLNVFDYVVTFDDTHERKPHPAPFRRALELLGVDASEALMVGDWAERDMVGAKAIGMRTVFARYGDTFGTVHSGADWDVDDVWEVVRIVGDVNAAALRT
jgi:putative hydrolase of the HAD superfamily